MSVAKTCVGAVLLFIPVFCVAGDCERITWYVDAGNTTPPWLGTQQDPFQAIADGIAASVNGDTVLVMAGVYSGNDNRDLSYMGKSITVISDSGAQYTIVDCGGSSIDPYRGFIFENGESSQSVLEGFTISNGYAVPSNSSAEPPDGCGGGVVCAFGSSPTIRTCVFRNCTSENFGGGLVVCVESSPVIEECIFEQNESLRGTDVGGSGSGGALSAYDKSDPTVVDCVFSGNTSESHGGGISVDFACAISIENCVFQSNRAGNSGGGISLGGAAISHGCEMEVIGCLVKDNICSKSGGGIASFCGSIPGGGDQGSVLIQDCEISGNQGRNALGGGILQKNGSFLISGNIITNNRNIVGGGLYAECLQATAEGTIFNCEISGNQATTRGGGARLKTLEGVLRMTQCIISGNNSETDGGGLYAKKESILNCTILGNSATSGGGVFIESGYGLLSLTNSVIWGNTPDPIWQWIGWANVTYCNVEGGYTGTGNIDDVPLFYDPSNGDFHLRFDSPCREAGANMSELPDEDFEKDPRVAGPSGNEIVDMGADEFYYHLYHLGTVSPGSVIDVRIAGLPGQSPVMLYLGDLSDPPVSIPPYGILYLVRPPHWQNEMGTIPSNGISSSSFTVPTTWGAGDVKYLQALVGPVGNPGSRLTNLMTLIVE